MGYLHSTQISHIYADSYTLRRVGSRTGPVYPLYYTYYPYYLYYPRFPYMFPFPHTCTYDNWYLVLLLGTATGRYLRQLFLQHKYTQACEPLYNRCFIRQCQTAGEGDQNKELNTQAIVVSIGNHTSLSTALIVTISLQLVTLFNSAADLLAIASARQLSILTCCLSATTLTKNLSYCDALLCTN